MKHPKNDFDAAELHRYLEACEQMVKSGSYYECISQLHACAEWLEIKIKEIECLNKMPYHG